VPANRRAQTRYEVNLDADLSAAGRSRGCSLTNLSLGGCQVTTDERVPIGTRVQVSFRIPTHDKAIDVGGSVRWSSDLAAGVQFDGLRAKEVWSLNKYFESL
jgi:hypothetical protein